MSAKPKNRLIKILHTGGPKKFDELVRIAKVPTLSNAKADLKILIEADNGGTVPDEDLDELIILLKTGHVYVTLAELKSFCEKTKEENKNTSDPPLTWST